MRNFSARSEQTHQDFTLELILHKDPKKLVQLFCVDLIPDIKSKENIMVMLKHTYAV